MTPVKVVFFASFIVYSLAFMTSCGSKSSANKSTPQIAIENQMQESTETWSKISKKSFVNLDSAKSYNLFLFGNLNQPSADTEGSIAVGGNVTLANYSVGDALTADSKRYDLVVGGDLDFNSGSVVNGAAIVAGKIKTGSTSFRGGVKHGASPINFAQAQKNLIAESQRLSHLTATDKVQFQDWGQERGELTLQGEDNLNVFNIDSQTLSRTHTLRISAPQNSYVVINVSGKSVKLKSMGLSISGTVRNRVLFNFTNAESLEISEISLEGSILAPRAHINFTTGVVRGQVIAHSLTGSGQMNHDPIDQDPQPTPTPEPEPIPVDPEPIPQDPIPQPPPLPDNPEVPYL